MAQAPILQAPPLQAPPVSATKPVDFSAYHSIAPNTSNPAIPPAAKSVFAGAPAGSIKAPTVITSKPAEDHIATIKAASEQAQQDTQALQAHKVQASTPPPADTSTQTPPAPANPAATDTGNALDTEINSILDGLTNTESTAATPAPDESDTVTQDQGAIAVDQQTQQQVGDALDSMNAGSYPLSAPEQAQIDAIRTQYSGALDAANKYTAAKALGGTAAAAASGMEQYSPTEALGQIHSAVLQGQQKVDALNSKIIASQSKLALALQKDDYKTASQLYKEVSSDIKLRTDEIGKIQTSVQKGTDTLQKNALAVAKEQISTLLASDKLTMTEKQNIVNNANKSGTLDEKTRHDLATELTAQIKAQKSPVSLKPPVDSVKTTGDWINQTRGTDGYVDPNAYKQAFDAWINDGYMAKDFLTNYPPKQFINPANTDLPAYLESKTSTAKTATDVAAQIKAAFPSGGAGSQPTGQ